jgi:S-adenosylmethionine:tRNA ribosyltransferase-isomerase
MFIPNSLSDFDFHLPKNLLAEYPTSKRENSRLMVIDRKTESIEHKSFKDFPNYFSNGDLLIGNDTRVLPYRFITKKESIKKGANIEVLLLEEVDYSKNIWLAMLDPIKKINIDNQLIFANGELTAKVIKVVDSRERLIQFTDDKPSTEIKLLLKKFGNAPIPRYIKRIPEIEDLVRYQTIFAKNDGAIAAPTAGLHFSDETFSTFQNKNVSFSTITLHVGAGTFYPIEIEDYKNFKIHSEKYYVSEKTSYLINNLDKTKNKLCAIGTTSMRTLETSVTDKGLIKSGIGTTNIFIYPPYQFKTANCLLTNFHVPKSSLLLMVSAFTGYNLLMHAYKEAIKEKYRFYSYGDAMLIL